MFVAQQLRERNIVEYLLYMWQVEDLLRAFHLDIDRVKDGYLSRYRDLDASQRSELVAWYAGLIDMMHREHVTTVGHLQLCHNVVSELRELHAQLVASPRFTAYHAAYYEVLPLVVDLRQRKGMTDADELQACLQLLYGVMLLRVQQREVSAETAEAAKKASRLLALLSEYYKVRFTLFDEEASEA